MFDWFTTVSYKNSITPVLQVFHDFFHETIYFSFSCEQRIMICDGLINDQFYDLNPVKIYYGDKKSNWDSLNMYFYSDDWDLDLPAYFDKKKNNNDKNLIAGDLQENVYCLFILFFVIRIKYSLI